MASVLRNTNTSLDHSRQTVMTNKVGLWLILLLGAVLRLATLTRQSLWLDEGLSYLDSNFAFTELFTKLAADAVRPLHYLVLQPMIALGGSVWLLRLPSALAGIASIALFYRLGVELFDRRTGLLAAFILALTPFHIWYSQEARFYALVAAFVLAATLFAVRAYKNNRLLDWALLGTFQGLALLTETGAVWFTLAINLTALVLSRSLWKERRLLPWIGSQLLALLIFLPVLPNFLASSSDDDLSWIPPATVATVARTVSDFLGGFLRSRAEAILILALFCGVVALAVKAVAADARAKRGQYLWLAFWLAVPVGFSFLVSQPYFRVPLLSLVFAPGQSVFLTRNLIAASLPLYLFLARSLLLSTPSVRTAALAALVLLNLTAYFQNHLSETKDDYRSAARVVQQGAQPGDLIIFAPHVLEPPFAYYYHEGYESAGQENYSHRDGVISNEAERIYASPFDALVEGSRVWLVTTSNIYLEDTQGIAPAIAVKGVLLRTWEFQGVTLRLYNLESGRANQPAPP